MNVSRVRNRMFSIFSAKRVFEIFKKMMIFQNTMGTIIEIENDKFGTKYLKTHMHRVV